MADGTYDQTLAFTAENKLQSVTVDGQTTTFVYDGNGARVKKTDPDGSETFYVGGLYEKMEAGGVVTTTSYYYAGGQRVAMRTTGGGESAVVYLHSDHLGSTSLTTDAAGALVARVLYYPYGEERYTEGTLQTDYGYTGQRNEAGLGLMDYGARYYDPALGRFVSADTIVPGIGSQAHNRYMYVEGNPVACTDPTGHGGSVCSEVVHIDKDGNVVYREVVCPPGVCPEGWVCDLDGNPRYRNVTPATVLVAGATPMPSPTPMRTPRSAPTGDLTPEDEPWRLDALGWRLEASAGVLIGLDVNIDAVLNFNDQETGEWRGFPYAVANADENLRLFVSVDLQGADIGTAITTGPLFIDNMPRNEQKLEPGWYGFATGAYKGAVEVEVKLSEWTEVYIGGGVGAEGAIGAGRDLFIIDITDFVFKTLLGLKD